MFMKAVSEANNFGFNDAKLPCAIKRLLYQSLIRTKLMYGLEATNLSEKETKTYLSKIEGNVLKRAKSLWPSAKTTALAYAMNITPIKLQIVKRKIAFIVQLVRNQSTNWLITSGIHKSLENIIEFIGINNQHKQLERPQYEGMLLSACFSKLEAINECEKNLKMLPLVTAIRFLLNNRSNENDATIKHLLDPRRCSRG